MNTRWREKIYQGDSETKKWHYTITKGAAVPMNHRGEDGEFFWTRQEERALAQLRSNKSPLTRQYQNEVQRCRAQSLIKAQERQQADRGRGKGRGRRGRGRSLPARVTIPVVEPNCPDCHAAEETCEHLLLCPAWAEEREKIFGHSEIQPTVLINETGNTLEYLRVMARLTTRRPDPL